MKLKRNSIFLLLAILMMALMTSACGNKSDENISLGYENEALGFYFEIPKEWNEKYIVSERSEGSISYFDFMYQYGFDKKTTPMVTIIATDEATWVNQQLESTYTLVSISKEGKYFAAKVPVVPDELPFKAGSKKAKEMEKLLITVNEVGRRFSFTR